MDTTQIVLEYKSKLDINDPNYKDIVKLLDGIKTVDIVQLGQNLSDMLNENPVIENYLSIGNNEKLRQTAINEGMAQCHAVNLDLISGYTCAMADICHARARRDSRTNKTKLVKFEGTKFLCYMAKIECRLPVVYDAHMHNTRLIGHKKSDSVGMAYLILKSLEEKASKNTKIVRFHSGGDFLSFSYFIAWILVAQNRPDLSVFGYTKILPYVKIAKLANLDNFSIVYSFGGKMDALKTNEQTCYVISDKSDSKGLKIACENKKDTSDYNLITESNDDFCLLEHKPTKRTN